LLSLLLVVVVVVMVTNTYLQVHCTLIPERSTEWNFRKRFHCQFHLKMSAPTSTCTSYTLRFITLLTLCSLGLWLKGPTVCGCIQRIKVTDENGCTCIFGHTWNVNTFFWPLAFQSHDKVVEAVFLMFTIFSLWCSPRVWKFDFDQEKPGVILNSDVIIKSVSHGSCFGELKGRFWFVFIVIYPKLQHNTIQYNTGLFMMKKN